MGGRSHENMKYKYNMKNKEREGNRVAEDRGALARNAGEGFPTLELELPRDLESKASSRANSKYTGSGMMGNLER